MFKLIKRFSCILWINLKLNKYMHSLSYFIMEILKCIFRVSTVTHWGTCIYTGWPEFSPLQPHGEGRETVHTSCPQTHTQKHASLQIHLQAQYIQHTHTHTLTSTPCINRQVKQWDEMEVPKIIHKPMDIFIFFFFPPSQVLSNWRPYVSAVNVHFNAVSPGQGMLLDSFT